MSRRIEGWERWLAPDYCFYLIFLVYFLQPVLHEGRLHAVEGYPSWCNDGLFLFVVFQAVVAQ